jgi:WD40 repeat protein
MLNNKVYFTEKELNFDSKFMTRLESFFFKPRSGGLKEDSKEMLNLEVDWIYGINAKRQNIKHVCSKGLKAANERIVYTVGKVIIVYYPKLNSQQYYKEHRQSISVIEISKEQRLAASGEEGEYPQIHIWDMTTKKTLVKFSNLHKDSITFLKFIKNDRQLITASHNSTFSQSKMQTPLVILNLQTQEIIMSTFLQYEIIGFAFNHEFPLKLADFLVVSSKELAFFSQQQDSYQLFSEKIKINEPIVSFAFNQKGLLVTGHSRRKLYKWDDKFASQSITFASNYEKEIKEMVFLGDEQLFLMDENDL